MRHDDARTGLFAASSDDEQWNCFDFFDTREEAIAYGHDEIGGRFYTGQVYLLTDEDVADFILRDADEADEHLREQDEWVWCEEPLIEFSKEAAAELHALTVEWVKRHKARAECWRVDDIERAPAKEGA